MKRTNTVELFFINLSQKNAKVLLDEVSLDVNERTTGDTPLGYLKLMMKMSEWNV